MPIISYLAYPEKGKKSILLKELSAIAHCEATPADNEEVLVLVTDTPDDDTERKLQEKMKNIKSLQSLGMTFGHGDA